MSWVALCFVWAYLEDVSWFGAAHVDWSGHEVAAAGAVRAPHVDLGASLHITKDEIWMKSKLSAMRCKGGWADLLGQPTCQCLGMSV